MNTGGLNKKVICVTAFDNYSYNVRLRYVENFFVSAGYTVDIVASDFDHRSKSVYNKERAGLKIIHVKPYSKNISLGRISSHRKFARKSYELVKKERPDLVYVSGPPNYLFKYFAKYKNECKAKIIFDVIDMWPESMPINGILKGFLFFPFLVWSRLRDNYLSAADEVIFECDLFRDMIRKSTKLNLGRTIYLTGSEKSADEIGCEKLSEVLSLAYLGSINNIIDIDMICRLVRCIVSKRNIEIHIIGDGEKRDLFISSVKNAGAKVTFYGAVFDEEKKKRIFSSCKFGLNVMKKSVCVGATMKSIDYLKYGLPLINAIPYDTERLIEQYNCGYTINETNIKSVADKICEVGLSEIVELKRNALNLFNDCFSVAAFENNFSAVVNDVLALEEPNTAKIMK